jgi:hypothetical protein
VAAVVVAAVLVVLAAMPAIKPMATQVTVAQVLLHLLTEVL